jgi:hypothetical protein
MPAAGPPLDPRASRLGRAGFDLADSSDMPPFAEPFFMELNADVMYAPVMNGDDLQKGLSKLG